MTVRYSIVIMGGSQVGKNSLVRSAAEIYAGKTETTLLMEMGGSKFEVRLSCNYDTGLSREEQNEFAQADGFILVYDVTNKFSLERVRMYHQKIVQMHSPEEKFPLVIVGNKSDRSGEGEREVSTREGLQLGDEFGCPCFETSTTMNNKGVSEVFQEILRLIEKSNREKSFRIGGSGSPRGSPRGKRTGSGIGLLSGGRRGFLSFLESNREVDEEQEFEAYRRQRKEMEERAER